jgi:hypothetical protein
MAYLIVEDKVRFRNDTGTTGKVVGFGERGTVNVLLDDEDSKIVQVTLEELEKV